MNRRHLLTAGASLATLTLAGCAGPQVADYAGEKPVLDLRRYFNGTLDAYGVFMRCSWNGEQGVLDEDFTYADGTTQKRIWRLTHLGNGRYEGRADDVVGVAEGQVAGNAFRWGYTLALPVDGRVWNVQFDDWMYLLDDRVMLNKAVMSKFGIRLGEVTLSFVRRPT
jgi:Protein of unknown function (DUF3833)